MSNYNKHPETVVTGCDSQAWRGYDAIAEEILRNDPMVIVVDCYPGVRDEELLPCLIERLSPDDIILSNDIFFDGDTLTEKMQCFLTEDRVRGIMFHGTLNDFVDADKLSSAKQALSHCSGRVLIYGVGASLISQGDLLVYADLARWEIQLRYRKGMPNFKQTNFDQDFLLKYKRGFFVEWRVADRHKQSLAIDYYLDTNADNDPKMITSKALHAGLEQIARQPFRLVPYFDPGVWGGQWMKCVCNLDPAAPNYAWSFDGVPEENSLFLRYGDIRIETPAMNLVKFYPRELLGEKTFSRFGAEFPIRFDYLDTIGGQNLSLQVHPLTEYIQQKFGMTYTQDESYYILDTEGEDSGVYLGVKEGIDPEEFIDALETAQSGKAPFPAEKYVNCFPAKKHDHFLIPAGTVHCSSAGCMVLEVSATPYIFTFKLWDWDRVGLDGRPRPIHIEDGKQVIQYDRDTKWCQENLVNHFQTIHDDADYRQIRTGLHELEFIQTDVYTTNSGVKILSNGEFSMLNLVDGTDAVIESTTNAFAPYTVHYAETFVLPAQAGDFVVKPLTSGNTIKVLRANVRF
ncbi:MAG: class I mannose-6-phosphate isomerase [Clostridia bacterium]